jgi:hypothetical protein
MRAEATLQGRYFDGFEQIVSGREMAILSTSHRRRYLTIQVDDHFNAKLLPAEEMRLSIIKYEPAACDTDLRFLISSSAWE